MRGAWFVVVSTRALNKCVRLYLPKTSFRILLPFHAVVARHVDQHAPAKIAGRVLFLARARHFARERDEPLDVTMRNLRATRKRLRAVIAKAPDRWHLSNMARRLTRVRFARRVDGLVGPILFTL
jgi:hypothetical protein